MRFVTRVFVFTVAAFLLVLGPAAMAQANGGLNLSHFKFYNLETHEPPIVQFYLNDQFGASDLLTAQGPKALGLPTMKNDEPILDEFAHLTMYSFFEPQPGRNCPRRHGIRCFHDLGVPVAIAPPAPAPATNISNFIVLGAMSV